MRSGGTPNFALTPAGSRRSFDMVLTRVTRSVTSCARSLSPVEITQRRPRFSPSRASVPMTSSAALRRSGNAWKARYRYDDPSTSSSVFSKGTYERQDSEIFRQRLAGGERRGRGLASVPHYVRIRRGHRANGRDPSGGERVRQRARSGRPSVL